jgi:hypothetical protein
MQNVQLPPANEIDALYYRIQMDIKVVGPSPQGHPLAEQSLLRQVQLYNLDYFRI